MAAVSLASPAPAAAQIKPDPPHVQKIKRLVDTGKYFFSFKTVFKNFNADVIKACTLSAAEVDELFCSCCVLVHEDVLSHNGCFVTMTYYNGKNIGKGNYLSLTEAMKGISETIDLAKQNAKECHIEYHEIRIDSFSH